MKAEEELFTIPIGRLEEEISARQYRINRETHPHYCPPGAGHWGMVKMAFQVPEIAVVFVIPMGCGRHGGIAVKKEGLEGVLAYLPIAEVDIVTGGHLSKTEDALSEFIEAERPKGIMLFSTCIDDLLGSDYDALIARLEEKYTVPIRRAKMNPLMSLSKKPPDMMIYRSMHDFIVGSEKRVGLYNTIGTPCPIDRDSEIHKIVEEAGFAPLQHVAGFETFEEHQAMGRAVGNLLIGQQGKRAVEGMEEKLAQSYVSVIGVFRPEGIRRNYLLLEKYFSRSLNYASWEKGLLEFLPSCRERLAGKTCVIGSTIQANGFELARFLTEMGMEVRYITAGMVKPVEREHLAWLANHSPFLRIIPSVEPSLARVSHPLDHVDYGFGVDTPAYFSVDRLVEISPDDGFYGYKGTEKLLRRILGAERFSRTIKEHVYGQNLVI